MSDSVQLWSLILLASVGGIGAILKNSEVFIFRFQEILIRVKENVCASVCLTPRAVSLFSKGKTGPRQELGEFNNMTSFLMTLEFPWRV